MEFLKLFMLKYALQTPWWLYIGAFLLTISCIWERGRKERKQIAIVMFFVGTVIMAILVWPDNYKAMSKLVEATYYYPEKSKTVEYRP